MARPSFSSALVGRAVEMARIRQAIAEPGSLVTILGEPGIGKSRLVQEAAAIATPEGFRTLTGHCEARAQAPLAPIATALRQHTRLLSESALNELCSGRARLAAHIFPELGGTKRKQLVTPSARIDDVGAAVALMLQRLAIESPLLLVIEDLHWADADTTDLIVALARRVSEVPFSMVVTARPEFAEQEATSSAWTKLASLPRATAVALQPLADSDAREMISAISVNAADDALADVIVERARGVPLFIEELCEITASRDSAQSAVGPAAIATIPVAISDAMLSRLRVLDSSAVHILSVAAVAGERIDRRLTAAAAGISVAEVDHTLRLGSECHLVVESRDTDGVHWSFRHALTRDALLAELTGNERRLTHLHVADALRSRYEADIGPVAALIAQHYVAADEPGEALTFALEAARYALGRGSPHETLNQYRRALHLAEESGTDTLPILLEAALASFPRIAGQDEAGHFARDALRLATQRGDRVAEARALFYIAREVQRLHGKSEEAIATGEQAIALCAGRDDTLESEIISFVVNWKDQLRHEDDRALLARGFALARSSMNHHALVGLEIREAHRATSPEDADAAFMRALAAARASGNAYAQTAPLTYAAIVMFARDRQARARELALEALTASELVPDQRAHIVAILAIQAAYSGEFAEALQWADQIADVTQIMTIDLRNEALIEVALQQGDVVAARRAGLWRDPVERSPVEHQLALRVQVALDPSAARPAAEAMIAGTWPPGQTKWRVARRTFLVVFVARALRQAREAVLMRDLANVVLNAPVDAPGAPVSRADAAELTWASQVKYIDTLRGLVAMVEGDYQAAETALSRAVDALAAGPLRPQQVETMIELADAQASAGHHAAAAATLADARRIASDMGAWVLVDRAASLGRSIGMRVAGRPKGRAGTQGLTDREVEVAMLVAEGCSNQEIAGRLYLSPRTAANHVSNVLSKLELRRRAEIARWAVESGLIGRPLEPAVHDDRPRFRVVDS